MNKSAPISSARTCVRVWRCWRRLRHFL